MNKPKFPICPILYEMDEGTDKVCPICDSSFKRKFVLGIIPVGTRKCINPECSNYFNKPIEDNTIFKPWYNKFK